jgi:hypothetical protein
VLLVATSPDRASLGHERRRVGARNRRSQMSRWDAAKAKAQKILGKDAKIPEPKFLPKLQSEFDAAWNAYTKSRDDLEAKILALQKTFSNGKLTVQQFGDKLEDEDFGLDEKNKDDAKKIKDAGDVLKEWWQSVMDLADENIKQLDDLDKHLVDFKKYKPKQP